MHAVTAVKVKAIMGRGSSIYASTGEVAEKILAKKLQKPRAVAPKATGNTEE